MRRLIIALLALSLAGAACSNSTDPTSATPVIEFSTTTLPPVSVRDFSQPHDPAALACGADRTEAKAPDQPALASRHIGGTADMPTPASTAPAGVAIATFTGVGGEGFDTAITVGDMLAPVDGLMVIAIRNLQSNPVRDVQLSLQGNLPEGGLVETGAFFMSPSVVCSGEIAVAVFDPAPLRQADQTRPVLVARSAVDLPPGFVSGPEPERLDLDIVSHGLSGSTLEVELRNANGEAVQESEISVVCFRPDGLITSGAKAIVNSSIGSGKIVVTSVELNEPACAEYLVVATGVSEPRA